MGSFSTKLKCTTCNREYDFEENRYLCDRCGKKLLGSLLTFPGILEVDYNYKKVRKTLTKEVLEYRKPGIISKYGELLPLHTNNALISLGEGGTFLSRCERLGHELGLNNLYLKDETSNPSGCFKDRETAVAVNMAKEYGYESVACASTGSSAASLAAYASKANLNSYIFVPDAAPTGKIVHILMHGAHLFRVHGIYEETLKLEIEACDKYGWFNCSAAINPFRIEGDKTIAYEICEELDWEAPDRVIISTGGGGNLSGEWKGFKELFRLGYIKSLPKMVAVQVEAGASLAKAFLNGKDEVTPVKAGETIAGSILAAYSDYGSMALKALRESNGGVRIVSDDDILEAQRLIAKMEGIYAEPSGAASIAGLVKMVEENEISKDEIVVCLVTGTGLRDININESLLAKSSRINPNIADLRKALQANLTLQ